MSNWEHWENWRWRNGPVEPGPAVVFDMDGVLSDASGRQHYLKWPRQDWDGFFSACGDDALLEDAARMLQTIDPDHRIVLLTARPLRVRPQTLVWLERHELHYDLLVMRDHGDWMPASMFKERSVEELRSYGFDLRLAFEDDRRNVAMLRRLGVPCVYIHSGYYE